MITTFDRGETIQLASERHLSWLQAGGEGRRLDSQATIQSANWKTPHSTPPPAPPPPTQTMILP